MRVTNHGDPGMLIPRDRRENERITRVAVSPINASWRYYYGSVTWLLGRSISMARRTERFTVGRASRGARTRPARGTRLPHPAYSCCFIG